MHAKLCWITKMAMTVICNPRPNRKSVKTRTANVNNCKSNKPPQTRPLLSPKVRSRPNNKRSKRSRWPREQLPSYSQPTGRTDWEKRLAELQQQRTRLADAQQAQQRQQQELQRLDVRKEQIATQLLRANTLRQQQTESEGRMGNVQQEIDERRNQLAQFKAEADALKAQSDTLNQAGTATCPVCEQPLTEKHRTHLLERNQQRVVELRNRYATEQTAIKNSEAASNSSVNSYNKPTMNYCVCPEGGGQ